MSESAWVILSGGVVQDTSPGGVQIFDYDDIKEYDASDLGSNLERAVSVGCQSAATYIAELLRVRIAEQLAQFNRGNGLPRE